MKLRWILLPLSILAVCVSRLRATYANCKSTFYRKLPLDDVVVTQDVISDVSVRSKIDCARACVAAEECVTSTFWRTQMSPSGHCQLYWQVPDSTMDQGNSPGARSYSAYDPCAEGYSWEWGRCVKLVTDSKTYSEARQHCQDLSQGQLVVFKTLEEMHCAIGFMVLNGLTNSVPWVGVNDLAVEGRYLWEDGTLLPIDSAMWGPQQPDNHEPNEDCIAMNTQTRGLHDNLCHIRSPFICEKTPL